VSFVSEAIVVDGIDAVSLAAGQPVAPQTVTWRGERYEIAGIDRAWRTYKRDRGDQYVDRDWFALRDRRGTLLTIYYDRHATTKKRWWLYTIDEAASAQA
jgi:hypothetical protein